MKNNTPTTKNEAVARYQELYEEHVEKMYSCDMDDLERCREISAEQAQLERDFPGTLETWNNQ